MNALQFYYINEVLGIESVMQPKKVQSFYRIYRSSISGTPEYFFFVSRTGEKELKLIRNMAKAIDVKEYMVIEIIDLNNSPGVLPFNNLLTRFLPKGFVIFGPELASHFNNINIKKVPMISKQSVSICKNISKDIPGVILYNIPDLMDGEPKIIQQRKQESWIVLQKTFLHSRIY